MISSIRKARASIICFSRMRFSAANGGASLTEALSAAIGVAPFNGHLFDGIHFDCGDRVGFLTANIAYGLMEPEVRREVENFLQIYREWDILELPEQRGADELHHAGQ